MMASQAGECTRCGGRMVTDIIMSGTVRTCENCTANAQKAADAIEAQNRRIDALVEELAAAQATSEGRREQLSRLACEKTLEWKRAENAEAERDRERQRADAAERRIAELEAVLREVRPWFAQRERWCRYRIDAALAAIPVAAAASVKEGASHDTSRQDRHRDSGRDQCVVPDGQVRNLLPAAEIRGGTLMDWGWREPAPASPATATKECAKCAGQYHEPTWACPNPVPVITKCEHGRWSDRCLSCAIAENTSDYLDNHSKEKP